MQMQVLPSTHVTESKLTFLQVMYVDLTIWLSIVYAISQSAKKFAISDIDRALSRNLLQHRIVRASPLDEITKSNELVRWGAVVPRIN